jgi:transcriptional regulator with XRE-family HTH domain
MSSVNTRWFQDKVRDAQMSQNRLAQLLGIDKSALSLMFNGKREMKMDEAARLAEVLSLPLDEVMAHAGVKVPKGPRSIAVIGTVDASMEVHAKKAGGRVTAIEDLPRDTVALRCEDQASLMYGWVFYYSPSSGIAADAMQRLCVVKLATGAQYLLTPTRGFEPGTHNLKGLNGFSIDNQRIVSASPVLWTRT